VSRYPSSPAADLVAPLPPPVRDLPAVSLPVGRIEQPDDLTCGPTALLQIYRFHGEERPLDEVIRDTPRNPDGGTLAVYLAQSALVEGWRPTLFSFNLDVFDPTWSSLAPEALVAKLEARHHEVEGGRLRRVMRAYIDVLRRGGRVRLVDLDRRLLVGLLAAGHPILAGLSATWLYRSARELGEEPDDVGGWPVGHFVVISGYEPEGDLFLVVDPSRDSPFNRTGVYPVPSERLMAAILLGDVTMDAVLLVLDRDGVDGTAAASRHDSRVRNPSP
jgi:hypothetical protein